MAAVFRKAWGRRGINCGPVAKATNSGIRGIIRPRALGFGYEYGPVMPIYGRGASSGTSRCSVANRTENKSPFARNLRKRSRHAIAHSRNAEGSEWEQHRPDPLRSSWSAKRCGPGLCDPDRPQRPALDSFRAPCPQTRPRSDPPFLRRSISLLFLELDRMFRRTNPMSERPISRRWSFLLCASRRARA